MFIVLESLVPGAVNVYSFVLRCVSVEVLNQQH